MFRAILLGCIFGMLLVCFLSVANGQTRTFAFVQFGDTIQPKNGAYWIERQYFDMIIDLADGDEVIMKMSADSTVLNQIRHGAVVDTMSWFKSGTGLLDHKEYRMNWLLFNGNDYMLWKYKRPIESSWLYHDSLVTGGFAVTRKITSFDFTNQGGLDGIYSVFLVPVTWLYVTYFVRYRDDSGNWIRTEPKSVKIRMMGL